jgi:periplasmic divalent cation tolerance protein
MDAPEAPKIVAILTSLADSATARDLAQALVEERLAACATIIPGAESIYRWEGAVRTEAEVLLLLKTSSDRLARLRDRLEELHAYELPEVLVAMLPQSEGPYADWVRAEVGWGP